MQGTQTSLHKNKCILKTAELDSPGHTIADGAIIAVTSSRRPVPSNICQLENLLLSHPHSHCGGLHHADTETDHSDRLARRHSAREHSLAWHASQCVVDLLSYIQGDIYYNESYKVGSEIECRGLKSPAITRGRRD